ncbi:MAG: chromosome partitioning protein ParB [Zetaproteobacteria bacterium CG12_big_fil_rev_8_21_14_0_65_54_13]|nr:MAG: chromosome partitioning protein ParB [Zetaproteobacteria bacterium CG23_combo_of_CG06-09_8_20_14_all_54_7]PIW48808.1 MAG: chromosome partitioning protein ParB [Zetaproteobacteria bacterium CG12_big_fil_rev_8_21_14_0_65_54_13]PIX53433.1 MAG: chromosome partitioning protein ParB [Zetaproteobacteria bacterium CG_4_10_14_3_um_filter_54_28]PJA30390.1 MAG: chromosome partitioning protein ParB [Zetaproteobacteria bacterium CG_4_9_14_3_um_filter_54_145]
MAVVKNRGLGRGLNALLGDKPTAEVMSQTTQIPISKICPNSYQPRTCFASDELLKLTESIRSEGVLMPVLIRPNGDGYELIAGERRWRAAQAAGLVEIPAVVRDVSDLQALELAIIENEQRDDLSPIESAAAYNRMIVEFGCTQQQVAEKIGISRVQVSNLIRLLQLSVRIKSMIERRILNMGQARPLVGLPEVIAEKLADECVEQGLSARQMEQAAKKAAKPVEDKVAKEPDADVAALQDELSRKLGLSVELACKPNGAGVLRIRYTQAAELDGVLRKLRG